MKTYRVIELPGTSDGMQDELNRNAAEGYRLISTFADEDGDYRIIYAVMEADVPDGKILLSGDPHDIEMDDPRADDDGDYIPF